MPPTTRPSAAASPGFIRRAGTPPIAQPVTSRARLTFAPRRPSIRTSPHDHPHSHEARQVAAIAEGVGGMSDIPEWAEKRATDLTSEAMKDGSWLPIGGHASAAFARYIAEHEEPPVDPL